MESGIFTVKDCFELVSYIATLIGVGALIFGVYSYKLTQKQLNFSVIERCISNFSKDFSSISQDSDFCLAWSSRVHNLKPHAKRGAGHGILG